MLTGMILSGSWLCFEDTQKLSQLNLSILGDHLSSISQAYQCLIIDKNNQYLVRGRTQCSVNNSFKEVSFAEAGVKFEVCNSILCDHMPIFRVQKTGHVEAL